MSWGTIPMRLATTPQSKPCQQEAVAAGAEPASNVSGMFLLMAKAGHDEGLKPAAQTKHHFSFLECWATRTMRW